MLEHVEAGDAGSTVIAMVEDPGAVEAIEEIIAVPGIDCVFVGRGDLAVAMQQDAVSAPAVAEATLRVLTACGTAGMPVMLHVGEVNQAAAFIERQASAFLVQSDQGMLRAAGQAMRTQFSAGMVTKPG